jgi:hypothetical protein
MQVDIDKPEHVTQATRETFLAMNKDTKSHVKHFCLNLMDTIGEQPYDSNVCVHVRNQVG